LQASFGTAWQASGNFSSSKASGIPIALINSLAYLLVITMVTNSIVLL